MSKGTVPQGTPPNNNSAEVPISGISTGAHQAEPPAKPSAKTGIGYGPSISIPKVGKGGA